jgi:hypothetical protein
VDIPTGTVSNIQRSIIALRAHIPVKEGGRDIDKEAHR